jgi:hypothetical protein
MMLFHSSCPKWDKVNGPVPRLVLREQGIAATRTYVCERCGCMIHVDMDWKEGALPEREATFA